MSTDAEETLPAVSEARPRAAAAGNASASDAEEERPTSDVGESFSAQRDEIDVGRR